MDRITSAILHVGKPDRAAEFLPIRNNPTGTFPSGTYPAGTIPTGTNPAGTCLAHAVLAGTLPSPGTIQVRWGDGGLS